MDVWIGQSQTFKYMSFGEHTTPRGERTPRNGVAGSQVRGKAQSQWILRTINFKRAYEALPSSGLGKPGHPVPQMVLKGFFFAAFNSHEILGDIKYAPKGIKRDLCKFLFK